MQGLRQPRDDAKAMYYDLPRLGQTFRTSPSLATISYSTGLTKKPRKSREWMMEQIVRIAKQWRTDAVLERCGVGFGGPVDFASQRVTVSNVVADWQEFPLAASLE